MENFKKGFVTTLGVLAAMSVWATVNGLFKKEEETKPEQGVNGDTEIPVV